MIGEAESRNEATAECKDKHPDVIVMDIVSAIGSVARGMYRRKHPGAIC